MSLTPLTSLLQGSDSQTALMWQALPVYLFSTDTNSVTPYPPLLLRRKSYIYNSKT